MRRWILHERAFDKVIIMKKNILIFSAALVFLILLSSAVLAPSGTGARFNTKTVMLFLNSSDGELAAAGWNNFTTNLSIPDTSITILNAYMRISGTTGAAATTATTINVYLNETVLGKFSRTESGEVSGFEFLANASRGASGSDFYSLGAAPQYNKISLQCGAVCNSLETVAFITYKYDPPPSESHETQKTFNQPQIQKEANIFEKILGNIKKLLSLVGL